MPIFSAVAFSALIVAVFSIFYAIKSNYRLYWVSAIGMYIFSFLAGFSIGQITVGLTFIPLTLAIGFSLGWIKNKIHSIITLCLGVLVGLLMVLYVDDAWLFFPFSFLS